jgi:hypothetical protein
MNKGSALINRQLTHKVIALATNLHAAEPGRPPEFDTDSR